MIGWCTCPGPRVDDDGDSGSQLSETEIKF